jgi:hypothetical protein
LKKEPLTVLDILQADIKLYEENSRITLQGLVWAAARDGERSTALPADRFHDKEVGMEWRRRVRSAREQIERPPGEEGAYEKNTV